MDPQDSTAEGPGASGPKVLEKTLRVLDLFTAERPSWSVTEVGRELSMPNATTHRIMQALERRSYLVKDGSRYRLGFAAIDLGRRATASIDMRARLRGVLRELARASGETAILTVYEDRRHGSLCIDRIETTHSLRLAIEIGRVTPIHAGASAKALLAYLDEAIVNEVLGKRLERLAPGTITAPRELRDNLRRIRDRGWAESYEENNAGAWGLAAPIVSGDRVVASIGIAAPTARHSDSAVRSWSKLVRIAARESSARLGSATTVGAGRSRGGVTQGIARGHR